MLKIFSFQSSFLPPAGPPPMQPSACLNSSVKFSSAVAHSEKYNLMMKDPSLVAAMRRSEDALRAYNNAGAVIGSKEYLDLMEQNAAEGGVRRELRIKYGLED